MEPPHQGFKEPRKPIDRVAEIAVGKAAECVAVACCCPCSLLNLLILALVKLPSSLFRRAATKKKKKKKKKKEEDSIASAHDIKTESPPILWPVKSPATEVSDMEKKMWPQFFGTGFWRSPSQRE